VESVVGKARTAITAAAAELSVSLVSPCEFRENKTY
jgi:hypothetical protein